MSEYPNYASPNPIRVYFLIYKIYRYKSIYKKAIRYSINILKFRLVNDKHKVIRKDTASIKKLHKYKVIY